MSTNTFDTWDIFGYYLPECPNCGSVKVSYRRCKCCGFPKPIGLRLHLRVVLRRAKKFFGR